jgi:hypothetical protein
VIVCNVCRRTVGNAARARVQVDEQDFCEFHAFKVLAEALTDAQVRGALAGIGVRVTTAPERPEHRK